MRATAQTNQCPRHFQQQSGAKMAAAAIKMEARSAQSEPKGVQRTPKGARREPEGSQKDVKREPSDDQNASKYRCPKIVRKNGALFPVLRHILGVILGAKLHQKRIQNPIWNLVL